jgi:hypothetical protein
MAWHIAVAMRSRVRALAARKAVWSWLKPNSMGDQAGESGGQKRRRTPRRARACCTPLALWADRVSSTTISPGARVGPSTCVT